MPAVCCTQFEWKNTGFVRAGPIHCGEGSGLTYIGHFEARGEAIRISITPTVGQLLLVGEGDTPMVRVIVWHVWAPIKSMLCLRHYDVIMESASIPIGEAIGLGTIDAKSQKIAAAIIRQ